METSTPRHGDSLLTPTSISELSLKSRETSLQSAADLLVLLTPSDRGFDSSIDSSDLSSLISIPFSDPVIDECMKKEVSRDRRLLGEDVMTFSEEFMKTMAEFKSPRIKSLGPDDMSSVVTMMAEDPETIMENARKRAEARRSEPRPPPCLALAGALERLGKSIEEYRSQTPAEEEEEEEEPDSYDEGEEEEEVKEKRRKASKTTTVAAVKKVLLEVEDDDFYDTSSGMWRMLAAYDDLILSKPGYKESCQEDRSWLETDPVPWTIMEESRSKCLEWLERHHGQIGL